MNCMHCIDIILFACKFFLTFATINCCSFKTFYVNRLSIVEICELSAAGLIGGMVCGTNFEVLLVINCFYDYNLVKIQI